MGYNFLEINDAQLAILEHEREQQLNTQWIVERRTLNPFFNDLRFNHGYLYLGDNFIGSTKKVYDTSVTMTAMPNNKTINLSLLRVLDDRRNNGLGTQTMNIIADLADKYQKDIRLTTTGMYGSDPDRLLEFYQRFGFVYVETHDKGCYYMKRHPKVDTAIHLA